MQPATSNLFPIYFKQRFPALDGVRALAILMVFALHYGGGAHGGRWMVAFNAIRLRGWVGVDLFFVLSGFLITGVLYDTREDSHFFRRFFARRALRIFPVFYLAAVVVLMLTPVFAYQWRPGQLPLLIYLGNIPAAFDDSLYRVVSANHLRAQLSLTHLWSLCVEEQIYVLRPLVVWRVRDRVRLLWVAGGISLLALGLRGGMLLYSRGPVAMNLVSYTLPFRMDALLVGGMLALLLRGGSAERWQGVCKWVLLVAGSMVGAIFVLSPAASSPWLLSVGLTLIALAGAGLIGWALSRGTMAERLLRLRPLRVLGRYSYGFYVYHLIWAKAWVYVAERLTGILHSGVLAGGVTTLINFGLTFLVAKWSFDWFEVRWLRLKVRFAYDAETGERLGSLAAN
jgi:peptidoglycan/LPS O-acetylase OafA/YrhL